ncbi:hypothetical protein EAH_00051200 [Eimeria acervulina]|uniref:Uncharacterized protein n=1 Tax=Eimeria acervulina TaxID=5801 RepID=U6GXG1_EIMAC|nr:hypothetical protein EAH_00051200 [Eimeria acervulina]CDI84287.1 hypothetical protein EAH_00051200 [Eimeria acervulina]
MLARAALCNISTGAFEQAMRACACALMEAAYCSLVHARCWSKVGSCLDYADFPPHVRHASHLQPMRIDRGSSGLWGKQSRLRDTNMLQDALDMGVPRVEARVESDAVPALLVSGCAKRRQGMVARVPCAVMILNIGAFVNMGGHERCFLGARSCEVVLGFVGQRATIIRNVRELQVSIDPFEHAMRSYACGCARHLRHLSCLAREISDVEEAEQSGSLAAERHAFFVEWHSHVVGPS